MDVLRDVVSAECLMQHVKLHVMCNPAFAIRRMVRDRCCLTLSVSLVLIYAPVGYFLLRASLSLSLGRVPSAVLVCFISSVVSSQTADDAAPEDHLGLYVLTGMCKIFTVSYFVLPTICTSKSTRSLGFRV